MPDALPVRQPVRVQRPQQVLLVVLAQHLVEQLVALEEAVGHVARVAAGVEIDGEVYEMRHPESAILMKSDLMLVYPEKDRCVIAATAQVSKVQPPQPA
ncbi:MAG TPA: hypothetical protein VNH11_12515 [Pirellulales bacterium]|nr:hypothetical protein [Pirellulales bacterium]